MSKNNKEVFEIVKYALKFNEQYEQQMSIILLGKYNETCLKDKITSKIEFEQVIKEIFDKTIKYTKEIDITSKNFKKIVESIEEMHNTIKDDKFQKYYNLYKTGIISTRNYYIIQAKFNYFLSIVEVINSICDIEISIGWINMISDLKYENELITKQIEKLNLEMQDIYNSIKIH